LGPLTYAQSDRITMGMCIATGGVNSNVPQIGIHYIITLFGVCMNRQKHTNTQTEKQKELVVEDGWMGWVGNG